MTVTAALPTCTIKSTSQRRRNRVVFANVLAKNELHAQSLRLTIGFPSTSAEVEIQ